MRRALVLAIALVLRGPALSAAQPPASPAQVTIPLGAGLTIPIIGELVWGASVVDATHGAPLQYTAECGPTPGGPYPFTFAVTGTPLPTVIRLDQIIGPRPALATPYSCVVTASNAGGESLPSPEVTFLWGTVPPPPLSVRSPFKGAPFPVPGVIQAEDFDNGGEGLAYHDLTPGNAGGQYRLDVDVDIIAARGAATGFVVNNFDTGEWLTYSILVGQTGIYRLELNAASADPGTARWHAEIDDVVVTPSVVVPTTGSWAVFQWTGSTAIALIAGPHVLKIVADQQWFDLDAIRLTPADTTPPTVQVAITSPLQVTTTTVVTATFVATAGDNVGVVGVQWKVDGVNVVAEQTAPPYRLTRALTKGTHQITAVARDAAGNVTTATAVQVVVP